LSTGTRLADDGRGTVQAGTGGSRQTGQPLQSKYVSPLMFPLMNNIKKMNNIKNRLKILKTSLLSRKDIRRPDSSSSNKPKPTSNMRQQEEMQQHRIIHTHAHTDAHTNIHTHTGAHIHSQTHTYTLKHVGKVCLLLQ
jgi:hypothetical protein